MSALIKTLTTSSIRSFSFSYRFLDDIHELNFSPNCVMASFDVVSLFTSDPIDLVGEIIREIWPVPCTGSNLDVEDVIDLFNFCLSSNCKPLSGTAMGSLPTFSDYRKDCNTKNRELFLGKNGPSYYSLEKIY